MGVKGLWKLLDGTGHPIDLEALEGKILAVDISVWLNMAIKGMRDYHGHASQTAHLVSLFNRICKLLYHGIKPVFVFDGKAPLLKQKALRERRERKTINIRESKNANEKILQNFLKKQLLDEVIGSTSKESGDKELKSKSIPDSKPSNLKGTSTKKPKSQDEDIYNLPPLSSNFNNSDDIELEEELTMRAELQREFQDNINQIEFGNMLNMNIESKDFNMLPSDVQYELLQDLREVRKRQRTSIEIMPEESNSFSNYQIKGLLAKRKLTKKMESVENKMSQENVDASSLLFGLDRESMNDHTVVAKQLVSDSKAHYIWMRKSSNSNRTSPKETQSQHLISDDSTSHLADTSDLQQPSTSLTKNKDDNSNLILINDGLNIVKTNDAINADTSVDVNVPGETAGYEQPQETIAKLPTSSAVNDSDAHYDVLVTLKATNDPKYSSSGNNNNPSLSKIKEGDKLWSGSGTSEPENEASNFYEQVETKGPSTNTIIFEATKDLPQNFPTSSESFEMEPAPCDSLHLENQQKTSKDCVPIKSVCVTPEIISATLNENKNHISDDNDSSDYEFIDVPEQIPENDKQTDQSSSSDGDVGVTPTVESQDDVDSMDENPWEGLDAANVAKFADELGHQNDELRKLMQAKQRAAREVTQSAQSECQDLLKLFGIPFLISPQEAEAQCAALEGMGLTDGTVTEDSDIWLFGGKYVIKDMFGSGKDPVAYKAADIETQLGLNRDRLICVALCSGSDYTGGIHGVGPVTAMEILKEFNGATGIEGLVKLKEWWNDVVTTTKQSIPKETKIKSQLRRVNLRKDFPSETIYKAYMHPVVNSDDKNFEWGFPDLEELRVFATDVMGWTRNKVDEILLPVIKREGQRRSAQSKITNFFQPTIHQTGKKRSRRVLRAAAVLTGKASSKKSSVPKKAKKQVRKIVTAKKISKTSELNLSESSSSENE